MENIKEIFVDLIDDPQDPMRSELNREALFELADNIKKNGLINPITVRPVGERFEVVAGHRRLGACKIAGLIRPPCVVRELTEQQAFAVMAAENIEREDVDPVDEAAFIVRYMEKTGLSLEETARTLRRSTTYVTSRLEIGKMPDYMREPLKRGEIKLGVALALFGITDEDLRRMWVGHAVRDGVNVRQAKYWFDQWECQRLPEGYQSLPPPMDPNFDGPRVLMWRCTVDGKEYRAEDCEMITIFKGNRGYIDSMRVELQNESSKSEISPNKIEEHPPA